MTMTTLENWRVLLENEHNDWEGVLDDWESEQQAHLLTEKELRGKITVLEVDKHDLLAALKSALSWANSIQEHDCIGWECSECYPQIMAAEFEQAIAKGGE